MNDKLKEILDTKVPEYTAALWWLGQMGLMVKMGKTLQRKPICRIPKVMERMVISSR